ncbi:MAG: NAD/NADP octopine/nopaline dehydrogenase family protein, partial [Methanomicrobiales archaeon]|nr:NAD/NADP octopine/nopaline dehydrogenase family protein [Methanomicrobiales archaeon]
MTDITIIGAGNSGLAMAAHLSYLRNNICLWNRTPENIRDLLSSPCITSDGVVAGKIPIDTVTSDISIAGQYSDTILVATPANSHRDIAKKISPHLKDNSFILLNPGRTFGALEFRNTLIEQQCPVQPVIAESQTNLYTCRKTSPTHVNIIAIKKDVLLSGINPEQNDSLVQRIPMGIRSFFIPAESMIETSIGNVGMILHPAVTILNTGGVENPHRSFKHYYEGITPTVAHFLEKLDRERITVSQELGKPVESTAGWLRRSYHLQGSSLYECIQNNQSYRAIDAPVTLHHRYICEDIPYGLSPLEAIGKKLGLPMKSCGLVIDMASEMMDTDLREKGR